MAKRQSMRDKMRNKLKTRTKESHSRRDSNNSFKNCFNPDKMEGVTTWYANKADHLIDIIPYFAGPNDPRNKEGEPSYVLDIEVHMYAGPMAEMIVCPEQYSKPCPICEESRRVDRDGGDWKTEVKPLKPKRRVMYNVIVRDEGAMEKKGVQVFEISHFFMEKHLSKISKSARGGGFTVFSDPDEGRTIAFERTGTGSENTGYDGHHFEDRPEPITDAELESAHCLDELILLRDYDDIYESFFGTAPDGKSAKEDEPVDDKPADDEPLEDASKGIDEPVDEPTEEPPARRQRRKRPAKNEDTPKCPFGHTIGADIDEKADCENCDDKMYDTCNNIADSL